MFALLLRTINGVVQRGYFVFSFGFLLFRTISVAIYASSVNDESKEPTSVLYSVPSSVYNREVKFVWNEKELSRRSSQTKI